MTKKTVREVLYIISTVIWNLENEAVILKRRKRIGRMKGQDYQKNKEHLSAQVGW